MAQELAPWRPQATTLSLEQRSKSSKLVIAHVTTSTEAARAAKMLIGQYAFLKTHDPDAFNASIAAVLQQYPIGLVQECIDPRRGAARKIKFLSVAELVEWLDDRLAFHQGLASWTPRPPEPPPKVYSEEHRGTMIGRFATLMRGLLENRIDPIERFKREQQRAREKATA
jgi:hypothetical protein